MQTICNPPTDDPETVIYQRQLKAGDRVVECGRSEMHGRVGTVYFWNPPEVHPEDSRRYVSWDFPREIEPESQDSCDAVGFPGDCKRSDHTPDTCPRDNRVSTPITTGCRLFKDAGDFARLADYDHPLGSSTPPGEEPPFLIGDTIHVMEWGASLGTGVIVAEEVWLEPNTPVAWDGVGERPADQRYPTLASTPPRFLVRMLTFSHGLCPSWQARCLEAPRSYPYVSVRDMLLISRPTIRVLNDSGCLGSAMGLDTTTSACCVSDSEAGARLRIAEMKASRGCSHTRHA